MPVVKGYYSTENSLLTSDGTRRTEPPYLDWLLEQKGDYHVCYHLDHFVACLCRLIQLEHREVKRLIDNGRLRLEAYTLDYIPGKFFSIKHGAGYGRPYILLSDISKFIEYTFTEDVTEGFRRAKQAKEAGEELADALVSLGLNPSTLVSPIRAWEKERMAALNLPTQDDVPEQVEEWAYAACKGNWVEAFARGHWDQAWDWDINSAYPYYASQLPAFKKEDWVRDFDGEQKTDVGVYRCRVEMIAPFHPVMYKNKNDENYTPTGTWEDCLSLKKMRFVDKYKLGRVRIIEGACLKPGERKSLLKPTVTELFKEKNKSVGIRREAVKRVMTGIYGKLLEVHLHGENTFGPHFNAVYGMEIENDTQVEVCRFCLDNGVIPLHVAVDGVLVDRELGIKSSEKIGGWRLASCCPALVIGSGQVAVQDKIGTGEFKLDYDWLVEHGVEEIRKLSPITLAKGLQLGREEDIGKLEIATKRVNLNSEVKRCYRSMITDWDDFMCRQEESTPWDVSVVASKIGELV